MAIVQTVEHDTEQVGGKLYPITITRYRSDAPFPFAYDGQIYLVDSATVTDGGRLGTSTVFTVHQDYTAAECQAGRESAMDAINHIVRQIGS